MIVTGVSSFSTNIANLLESQDPADRALVLVNSHCLRRILFRDPEQAAAPQIHGART